MCATFGTIANNTCVYLIHPDLQTSKTNTLIALVKNRLNFKNKNTIFLQNFIEQLHELSLKPFPSYVKLLEACRTILKVSK